MIGSTRSVRVFAYSQPADMRKGFDGLYGLVTQHLERDPLSGDMYLFVSGNRKRAKVLMWDGTGLCLYAKRLEKGRFAQVWGEDTLELTMSELTKGMAGSSLLVPLPLPALGCGRAEGQASAGSLRRSTPFSSSWRLRAHQP